MDAPTFTPDGAAYYLAAMIDGEGCIHVSSSDKWAKRAVTVVSTDRELIDACVEACLLLDIAHTVRRGRHRDDESRKVFWTLSIYRVEAIRKVAQLPIRCLRKRAKLAEALATVRESRRPSREVLERLYIIEGKPSTEIGRLVGVGRETVLRWLRDEQIPVRSKGEATALAWGTRG